MLDNVATSYVHDEYVWLKDLDIIYYIRHFILIGTDIIYYPPHARVVLEDIVLPAVCICVCVYVCVYVRSITSPIFNI